MVSTAHGEYGGQPKWLSNDEARDANIAEHDATLWASARQHRRAICWSVVISLAVIMEGYDTSLMPSFFGYPAFVKQYGKYYGEDIGYSMEGSWQAGLVNGANTGIVIGGFINGYASAKFGYKKTMTVAMASMIAFIFIPFFSNSVEVLMVGQVLCGLPWGVFATTGWFLWPFTHTAPFLMAV